MGRKLVVAAVLLVGAGVAWWVIGSRPAAAPPAHVRPAQIVPMKRTAAVTPDAAPRRAQINPPTRPDHPGGPVIAPPASGGFAAWTGLEGTHPGELEAEATAQGVPVDLVRESRRLLWLVEVSRNRPLVDQLAGHPVDDAAWTALVGAGNATLLAGTQLLDDMRAGNIDAAAARAQLPGIEGEYRADLERRTGLTDAQFDELFANAGALFK